MLSRVRLSGTLYRAQRRPYLLSLADASPPWKSCEAFMLWHALRASMDLSFPLLSIGIADPFP